MSSEYYKTNFLTFYFKINSILIKYAHTLLITWLPPKRFTYSSGVATVTSLPSG